MSSEGALLYHVYTRRIKGNAPRLTSSRGHQEQTSLAFLYIINFEKTSNVLYNKYIRYL